jgi:hypothetical protein
VKSTSYRNPARTAVDQRSSLRPTEEGGLPTGRCSRQVPVGGLGNSRPGLPDRRPKQAERLHTPSVLGEVLYATIESLEMRRALKLGVRPPTNANAYRDPEEL